MKNVKENKRRWKQLVAIFIVAVMLFTTPHIVGFASMGKEEATTAAADGNPDNSDVKVQSEDADSEEDIQTESLDASEQSESSEEKTTEKKTETTEAEKKTGADESKKEKAEETTKKETKATTETAPEETTTEATTSSAKPEPIVKEYKSNVTTNVGDIVSYRIEATSPAYSNTTDKDKIGFEIKDKLTNLEFVDKSIAAYIVKDAEDELINSSDYIITPASDGYTFCVKFTEDWIREHPNTKVAITYSAKVTEAAKIGSDANTNEATIIFNNDPTSNSYKIPDVPKVYTYGLELTKQGKNEVLSDVVFELYKDEVTAENKVTESKFGAETNGTFKTNSEGKITIKGLAAGTYYLKEIKTTSGYTLLANPVKIMITETPDVATKKTVATCTVDDKGTEKKQLEEDSGNFYYTFSVQNDKGFNLPATGGMGTYIFTIAGLVIMAGAAFLLIASKKRRA